MSNTSGLWGRLVLAAVAAVPVIVSAAPAANAGELLVYPYLGNHWDWLYGDRPLMVSPSETVPTDFVVVSIGYKTPPFNGPVHVQVDCCLDAMTRQPVTGTGLTAYFTTRFCLPLRGGRSICQDIGLPGGADLVVSPASPGIFKMRVAASNAPSFGQFIATVSVDSSLGTITKDVWVNVVPSSLPPDGPAPQCASGPEVISLGSITPDPIAWKRANLETTSYQVGVGLSNGIAGFTMTFEDPGTTTGPLSPDQSQVAITNEANGPIAVMTSDSFNCAAPGSNVVIPVGSTTTLFLTRATSPAASSPMTTTLNLHNEAIFSEGNFWTLFGGRKVELTLIGHW